MTQAPTAYEHDMEAEPEALLDFAGSAFPERLAALDLDQFERIVLTGMGGSDSAAAPLELALAQAGWPVWRLLTGRLLEMLALVTPRTLLIVTSQSGRSGEIVALLQRLPREHYGMLIGITNDATSLLGQAADHVILLHSGSEATVATRSYANTLAAFHRLTALLRGEPDATAVGDIQATAESLAKQVAHDATLFDALAARALAGPRPRFALIGHGPDATTVIAGAMVLKEAAKIAAEGYIGGAFRHGPLELAGPGLTAIFCGKGDSADPSLNRLARDIAMTGSLVATIGPAAYAESEHIATPDRNPLERLVHGMFMVQRLSVALGRATGIQPGVFNYGRKITDLL